LRISLVFKRDFQINNACLLAVAGALDANVAQRLQCGAVIEAANGAITPEADAVLKGRGIPVLPVSFSIAKIVIS
jgi:glutamate dehydrogenase/leucine dehydrogenase